MRRVLVLFSALLSGFIACATQKEDTTFLEQPPGTGGDSTNVTTGAGGVGGGVDGSGGAAKDAGSDDDGGLIFDFDAMTDGGALEDVQVCAAAAQKAETKQLPVDIIWMVDNSASMAPAVEQVKLGLNAFAATIEAKNLDYHVIMLSIRDAQSPITMNGGTRYPVCIAPPLAGDNNCGDGARFFQSSVDIKSTQPLEQFLGTLAQTEGYKDGQQRGGAPWDMHLRVDATKTIVIVTDDNARLSSTDFETFPGGQNPFNSLFLPPGVLDPSWNGLFKDYIFSGIYGWGSDVDPGVTCTYADGTSPPSPGPTYTTLVNKTKGVRAKICDGPAAWQPFFDAVAQAVIETSKLACNMTIPTPADGMIDYAKINVNIAVDGGMTLSLGKVADAAGCGASGGWYYNDPVNPTEVVLCPTSCQDAQASVGEGKPGEIQILFGCETILK